MQLTIWLAFIAGIVSFISPCVLPLVPAYIGYMGGRITHTVALTAGGFASTSTSTLNRRFTTVVHSLFFVAGFTFVFVTLGLFSTAFISVIGGQNIDAVTDIIGRVGGLVIIFFGLHFMGVMPSLFARLRRNEALLGSPLFSLIFALAGTIVILWGFTGTVAIWDTSQLEFTPVWAPLIALVLLAIFLLWLFLSGAFTSPRTFWTKTIDAIQLALYTDTRRQMSAPGESGYAGSAIMGVVFSAGWTPCIGPVYGAMLTLAANGGDVGQAGFLLAAYSFGLGIPFIVTAFMLDRAQGILRQVQGQMRKIELVSGAFLVLIGLLVASGQLQSLSVRFANSPEFVEFATNLEESVIGAVGANTAETMDDNGSAESDSSSSSLIITNPQTAQNSPAEATQESSSAIASIAELAADIPSTGISLGNYAPPFETISDSGVPVRLADLRGQVVLLNFWATWCGPCRVEMPEFESLYNQHKDEGFTVLAINNAETAAQIQGFRQELGLNFPMLMDETGEIQRLYSIDGYPRTFLLDRNGIIIARQWGPLTVEQIQELVITALAP